MNGSAPIVILVVAMSLIIGAILGAGPAFATQLPNPGDPGFPAIIGAFFAFVGSAATLLAGDGWEAAQNQAFKYGFAGTGLGLTAYLFGLVTGLY